MKRFVTMLLLPAALIACAWTQPNQQSQQIQAVANFYATILAFPEGGIPSQENIDRLSPLISRSFRTNLLEALAAEKRHFERTRNEEPPLVEGALFYSLFEGADRVKHIEPDPRFGPNACRISLEHGDPNDRNEFVQWQDRAVLVKENERWVVEDIHLLGDWEFGPKGKLSEILRSVAAFDAGQRPDE